MTLKQAQSKIVSSGFTEAFLVEEELWRFHTGTIQREFIVSLNTPCNFNHFERFAGPDLARVMVRVFDCLEHWQLMRTAS